MYLYNILKVGVNSFFTLVGYNILTKSLSNKTPYQIQSAAIIACAIIRMSGILDNEKVKSNLGKAHAPFKFFFSIIVIGTSAYFSGIPFKINIVSTVFFGRILPFLEEEFEKHFDTSNWTQKMIQKAISTYYLRAYYYYYNLDQKYEI